MMGDGDQVTSKRDEVGQRESPSNFHFLRRLMRPLRSRKMRVALATGLGAVAAEVGLDVSPDILLAITGIGASLILGIAHEDAGRNAASHLPQSAGERLSGGVDTGRPPT
jgi:hypothetical protein